MTIIRYFKAQPTDYVLLYKGGTLKKQGEGLSFMYYTSTSNIARVPLSNQDQPFIFREATSAYWDRQ